MKESTNSKKTSLIVSSLRRYIKDKSTEPQLLELLKKKARNTELLLGEECVLMDELIRKFKLPWTLTNLTGIYGKKHIAIACQHKLWGGGSTQHPENP